ncbi:MAG: hybrid sensor histidine kinase/response regulator, partial [Muribaculaceae bacterium]|nr:hybrid sensor histidine kinase/response regulator [Muribaculaceae bacterium]
MNNNINPSDFSILIVDDNATNTILLDAILKREKYRTLIARDGETALQIMQEKHPDLVLLDIMMPEMDGYETARRKSEIESISEIPFLFVTALSDTNNMVKGFKAGCSDFISKPFNTEEILIRIKHQLMSVSDKRTIINQTEELRRLVNNRDKLYAVVAHDLRSPLGTIKTVLNMLDESLDSNTIGDDMKELLHATTDSSNELFSLLEDLLSWTKSQMGKLIFQPSRFIFSDAINNAIKAATSMANLHNISITHRDLTDNAEFIGDQKMVTTVARNIIVNAIKFSEDDSSIEIESKFTGTDFV